MRRKTYLDLTSKHLAAPIEHPPLLQYRLAQMRGRCGASKPLGDRMGLTRSIALRLDALTYTVDAIPAKDSISRRLETSMSCRL